MRILNHQTTKLRNTTKYKIPRNTNIIIIHKTAYNTTYKIPQYTNKQRNIKCQNTNTPNIQ